ncbi:O-methyltransferase [Clostridium kluyveri]|uniref:tRNA 5-hydroxyuridine methyltransferase n=2 Tax=Clostridium kluyveri TaxID=1534 RepID=A5N7U3_CLOK5|nr:O-methyltransferase [Clostridium kluyveri]EDK33374.1 Predicted methyltransferase [Clostridium kluyveri DSM 555]
MSNVAYDYIECYIRSLIEEHKDVLKELEDYAKENSVPIVQKEVAKFLELMISIKKPLKILELGTAIGYSAILMSISSGKKSLITTVERDNNMVEIAKDNIEKYKFMDCIQVVEGDCLEVLKNTKEQYDFIFMDAGKGHYNQFLPYCLKLLDKDGIIVADNVLFRGMVAWDKLVVKRKITIVKRMREYLSNISDNNKFVTSIIPMGDGIAVTVRRN